MSKFNWGHGLTIFFICFISALGVVLYKSFSINRDLVKDDYYVDDLELRKLVEKKRNANGLAELKFKHDASSKQFIVSFPVGMKPNGTIQLYRPSDKSKDITLPIIVNENSECIVPATNMDKGLWRLKLDWSDGNKEYFFEEAVTL
jgi:nitrogen fixation protein FixH